MAKNEVIFSDHGNSRSFYTTLQIMHIIAGGEGWFQKNVRIIYVVLKLMKSVSYLTFDVRVQLGPDLLYLFYQETLCS